MEPSDIVFESNDVFLDDYDADDDADSNALGMTTMTKKDSTTTTMSIMMPIDSRIIGSRIGDPLIHSVFLADGIHHEIDPDALEDLPGRVVYKEGAGKGKYRAKMAWFGALLLNGIGMFIEAYVIITTGQIKTIWQDAYPECQSAGQEQHCPELIRCCGLFPDNPLENDNGTCQVDMIDNDFCTADGMYPDNVLCNENVIEAISYSEFAGIMSGMLIFGFLSDRLGRTRAGIIVSWLTLAGIFAMTFVDTQDTNTLFMIWVIFFGVFGLGVGGEYPLAASNAAAHHAEAVQEAALDDDERRRRRIKRDHARTVRRGETIAIVFSMQGVGAVVGSLFLVVLIYFGQQTRVDCEVQGANSSGTDPRALSSIWRSFYFIGLIFIVMTLLFRALVLEEGNGHKKMLARKQRRQEKLGKNGKDALSVLAFYAPRLLGTGGAWMVWDVAFYGLKLFSGPIFKAISPEGDLIVLNGYLVVNNIVALVGYYAAAAVIDIPAIGRKRLPMLSFSMCAVLFGTTAALFNLASAPVLLTLYMLSSFFGQFGANVTTYVMAAETYPTELRGACHGLSAFMGKCGALVGTIAFSQVETATIFWICTGVSIAGIFFTTVFCVDLTHVSLAEHDAQLELFLEGRPEAYKGKLNDKKHLSWFEVWTGWHGEYEPGWARAFVEDELKSNTAPESSL